MAIATHDDHQQRAELRIAFLKHLPKRVDQLLHRCRQFCIGGWDINGLSLLHEDVQRIAGTAGRYGALEVSEQLLAIESLLGDFLQRESVPDAAANERLLQVLDRLSSHGSGAATPPAGSATTPIAALLAAAPAAPDFARAEVPPSHYWRRWVGDAPAARPIGDAAAAVETGDAPTPTADHTAAAPAAARTAAPMPAREGKPRRAPARIYHLSDGSALAVELDQRLETLGDEIEILQDGDELKEVLTALAPDLIVVGAGFVDQLESIGTVLRSTRERTGARLPLLAISAQDSVPLRLSARRAGADALLLDPQSVAEVLDKIDELLDHGHEATYRVLVVEDDRAQGLFAESILRKAGMDVRVVTSAFEVLAAMEQFAPDLVLMDLYMPDCDGTELTALIRERDEFLHMPIVFLSGEHDLDKHYDALDAGGDDFLAKPIRPKHLIAAVSNRIRRARAMLKRVASRDPRDHTTGLFARSYVLDRINELLSDSDDRQRPGGVLFVDLDGTAQLREKLGLTGFEQLLSEVGGLLVNHLDSGELACRYGDGSFVLVAGERPAGALEALAGGIRAALIGHPFTIAGRALRLRPTIGIAALRLGLADAGALLNAAERASRDARTLERGVLLFEPPRRGEPEPALAGLIRDAIERDGFELLYQPIVAMQGGEESQYQTLLRLRDDAGRLHAAAALIPVAERADLMLDVDRWVLAQALRTIEMRRHQGASLRLFVNQAGSTVEAPDHADWLLAQLAARRVPGTQLVIELALDELREHTEAAIEFCRRLGPSGVQFCLTRFEATPDGDSVLDQLPVAFIKLASKYLGAVQAQPLRDELRVLVERAHRRGLQVIAQRVEDAQSAATLWMSGIDFIQGNLVQQAGRELAFDFQAAVL